MRTALEAYRNYLQMSITRNTSDKHQPSDDSLNRLGDVLFYGPEADAVKKAGFDQVLFCLEECFNCMIIRPENGELLMRRLATWAEAYFPDPARKERLTKHIVEYREKGEKSDVADERDRMNRYADRLEKIRDLLTDGPFPPALVNERRDGKTPEMRQLVALLRAGNFEEFNRIKPQYMEDDRDKFDQETLYLTEVDLRGLDLRPFDLTNVCFNGSNLSDVNLEGSSLERTQARKGTFFFRANLRGVDWDLSVLEEADFIGADLTGGKNFFSASHCDFSQATLTDADLRCCEGLHTSCFEEATMGPEQLYEILKDITRSVTIITKDSLGRRRKLKKHRNEGFFLNPKFKPKF